MTLPPSRWQSMGDSAGPHEAEALEALRLLLPDDPLCSAWANLSFVDRHGQMNEVDVLLLLRSGLFVLELKGWRGTVVVRQNDWRQRLPGEDRHFRSPLVLTDLKSKKLKGILEDEARDVRGSVLVPWVTPVIVFHGPQSTIDLPQSGGGAIYGLDGFGVKGVPHLTRLLVAPGRAPLTKSEHDAVVRLIEKSGLAPRVHRQQEPVVAEPEPEPVDAATAPLAELSDDDLESLRLEPASWDRVRGAEDLASLIGHVPDDVWDDLTAVAAGDDIDEVVGRRRAAQELFAAVARQADEAGWVPEEVPEEPASPTPSPTPPPHEVVVEPRAEPPASSVEEKLRSAFGDRVHSDRERRRRPKPVTPRPAPPERPASAPTVAVDEPQRSSISAELLLDLARSEALAGRATASIVLHTLVRSALDLDLRLDWDPAQVDRLCEQLDHHPHLVRQIREQQLSRGGTPDAVVQSAATRGALWTGSTHGPVFSLLVRVPDVVQRSSGIFLSQVIGREPAAEVNAELRLGRPDGGRLRVVDQGTVISRQSAESPWFVVGQVTPESWFLV